MKKRTTLVFLFTVLVCFVFSGSIIRAEDFRRDEAVHNPTTIKVEDPVVINVTVPVELALLYDNGPFVTAPGGGPVSGSDGSVLTSPMTTLGFGHATTTAYRIADDILVPVNEIWQVDSIVFYAYQTNSPITSTITAVNYRVWSGNPGSGSVVFGDTATNKLTATYFSNCYRYSSTAIGTTRPIMANRVNGGFSLSEGTYWLDWATAGSLASGPWAPPITISGQTTTGNAKQRDPNLVWNPANDGGSLTPQGFPFKIYGTKSIVPVELTSFVAYVIGDQVELNWTTATELNNKGFEVQRSMSDDQFLTVGFVNGHGTTAQTQSYSFMDKNTVPGRYSYRLKQVDFDGTFEYSNIVEADVTTPLTFSMGQNFPNPFNPTTNIKFNLAVDSKVSLKVFNILGQEVVTLVKGNLSAGSHSVEFNAKGFQSGVYFAKIEANGIDGQSFSSVKKMILNK